MKNKNMMMGMVIGLVGVVGVAAQDTAVGQVGNNAIQAGEVVVEQAVGVFQAEPSFEPVPLRGGNDPSVRFKRERGFYIGAGAGISNVKPKDSSRNEDGVAFDFSTEDDDLSSKWYLGYWINQYVGIELGGVNLGQVSVPFNFSDPRNGRNGTGEAEVEITGTVASILVGGEVLPGVTLYARGGANSWDRRLESRFDVVGENSVRREQERSGTGLVYGAGMQVNFQAGWNLRAEAEFYDVDGDEVSVFSAGLAYDFGTPRQW